MSLETPIVIRTLQRKLYRKAKQEPDFRFYLLYDKIYREDILSHAYELAKANKGASGVDGQTFEQIESGGLPEWLEGIRKDLHNKTYKPQPVRRVLIPKPGGGKRPLGIPTIRDRTVQTAAKLMHSPLKRDQAGSIPALPTKVCGIGLREVVFQRRGNSFSNRSADSTPRVAVCSDNQPQIFGYLWW
jgi:retron-type reverse transcriptase